MNPNKVIQQYTEMCNNRINFQSCLAENSVLEWFGRTIRGRHKISHFYRYDLCLQYEHKFFNAISCDPIEKRSTHLETKKILPYESTVKTPQETTNSTPINFNIISPKLPALNRGISFISEDDDLDFKNLGLTALRESITPPPIKECEKLNEPPPLKKLKYGNLIESKIYSSLSKDEEFLNKINIEDKNDTITSINISQTPKINVQYSNLMYLEVNGNLSTLSRYSDINKLNTPPTPASYWDREIKLQISYRFRLDDNQIEFPLIIYEHLINKPTIRRNLLSEFQESFNDNEIIDSKTNKGNCSTSLNSINDPKEMKRKKPLKRFLRLF